MKIKLSHSNILVDSVCSELNNNMKNYFLLIKNEIKVIKKSHLQNGDMQILPVA